MEALSTFDRHPVPTRLQGATSHKTIIFIVSMTFYHHAHIILTYFSLTNINIFMQFYIRQVVVIKTLQCIKI
jgi:hypothetical protein